MSLGKALETVEEVEKRDSAIRSSAYEEIDEVQSKGFDYNPRPNLALCMMAQRRLGMAQMCFRLMNEMDSGLEVITRKDLEAFAGRILGEIDEKYPPEQTQEEMVEDMMVTEHQIYKASSRM